MDEVACSSSSSSSSKRIHAIVMPIPLQGHVIPAVQLALRLASNGFTVTFINTELIHHKITSSQNDTQHHQNDMFAAARRSGLDVRYRTVSDGFSLSFNRDVHLDESLEGLMSLLPCHVDELVGDIVRQEKQGNSDNVVVSCFVADTLFGWPSKIAEKYDLVFVSFWTEAALVFNIYYHLDLLDMNGHFGCHHEKREDTIDYIAGVKALKAKDLPSYLQETNVSTPMHKLIRMSFNDVKKADFILCNTNQDLESDVVLALQHDEKLPFISIGPLFPTGFTKRIVPTSLMPEIDCTTWLNAKPRGSVLYVSFGSFITCEKSEIDEIAHGLALSGVNFLWVLRSNAVSHEEPYVLPVGFEDSVKGKALIVTWTNQNEVISHASVGGFLTHCGWNSVLESAWCGVPILCFPLLTDQVTNRRLVVDDWRIGLNLCDAKPLIRSQVADKINRLMSGKSSNELREEAMKVRMILESGLARDGSSERNVSKFISDVKAKVLSKRI